MDCTSACVLRRLLVGVPMACGLSIQVEGSEEGVLQGLNFSRFRVRLMTIERPNAACKQLLHTS